MHVCGKISNLIIGEKHIRERFFLPINRRVDMLIRATRVTKKGRDF